MLYDVSTVVWGRVFYGCYLAALQVSKFASKLHRHRHSALIKNSIEFVDWSGLDEIPFSEIFLSNKNAEDGLQETVAKGCLIRNICYMLLAVCFKLATSDQTRIHHHCAKKDSSICWKKKKIESTVHIWSDVIFIIYLSTKNLVYRSDFCSFAYAQWTAWRIWNKLSPDVTVGH